MDGQISVLELRSVRGTGGGPEKTILLGTERTDRTRFAVTVCYIRDLRDGVFAIDRRARQMDIEYVEARERHSFDRGIWRTLSTLVQERQIDIIHAHDYKANLLAWFLARRWGGIPLSTAHGWTGQSARERYLYYPVDKRLLARFPRVIAVSSDVKHELLRCGARPDRVTVLLNSIDPTEFRRVEGKRHSVRHSLGYRSDQIIIGAVGRLERQKRFDLLLEAFAPLARARAALQLAIVGDGSLRHELAALAASLNIGGHCRLLGHRGDVADVHHAFDLFVQSSEYEGTPNAVLEAMALETPIVATDAGGTRELAANEVHALIIPTRDVTALRTAIEAVIADPAAAGRRTNAARRRVETELSFEARTRRLEGIYEELIRGRGDLNTVLETSPPSRARVPHA